MGILITSCFLIFRIIQVAVMPVLLADFINLLSVLLVSFAYRVASDRPVTALVARRQHPACHHTYIFHIITSKCHLSVLLLQNSDINQLLSSIRAFCCISFFKVSSLYFTSGESCCAFDSAFCSSR